jgi:hypothetical protein
MHDVELKLQRNAPSILVAPTAWAAATSVQTEMLPVFSRPCPLAVAASHNSGTDSSVLDAPLGACHW